MSFADLIVDTVRDEFAGGLDAPTSEADLADLLRNYFGVVFPDTKICEHHSTPWRTFCDAYFARHPMIVVKGSRLFAGKSFWLATLGLTEAVTLGIDVDVLGGSGAQSKRVVDYMTKHWHSPGAPTDQLVNDPGTMETKLTGGNKVRALLASQRSVRGSHPTRLRLDEVDEMPLDIFDAAMGLTYGGSGVAAQTTIASTHHHADGTMAEILRRAVDEGWEVREWSLAQGTRILTLRGEVPIEDVSLSDRVLTRSGWKPIQHVTRMGERETLAIRLSNGRTIRTTADHRFAVSGGWRRADRLFLGAPLLVPALRRDLDTDAAVTPTVGASVGVNGVVGVPVGAFGPCQLCADMGGATHVLAVGDQFHVGRIATRTLTTEMVNLAIRWYRASVQFIRQAMRGRRPRSGRDAAVPVGACVSSPNPATGRLDRDARPEIFACIERRSVHVESINDGVIVPVWDIGVEGDHEFTAEGVIVHNCYRESLEPHGWLAHSEVLRKQGEMTSAQWAAEVELQEPEPEGRAIQTPKVEAMFDPGLGEFEGADGEELIIAKPEKGAKYTTGVDWAKAVDYTTVVTFRSDVTPMQLVAFKRTRRRPWPELIDDVNRRTSQYGSTGCHDATGMDVAGDYLTGSLKGVSMVGKSRADMLSAYVRAVEHDEMRSPRIRSMYQEHRFARVVDLYTSRQSGHLPDTVAAAALAYYAVSSQHEFTEDHFMSPPGW